MQESDYCFVVEGTAGQSYRLDVKPYDEHAKQHFQSVWKRLSAALDQHHKFCSRQPPAWTEWKPWDWCEERKPGYEGRTKYVGWCGDIPVGFLNVWPDFPSAHQPGKKILFLEHLAAARGNLTTEIRDRRFKSVGAALFAYTIFLSNLHGLEGRVGLHVAGDEAVGFYRRLNERCDGTLFHPDRTDVAGPTPRGEHDRAKTYLETTAAGADRWLGEYKP